MQSSRELPDAALGKGRSGERTFRIGDFSEIVTVGRF